MVRDDLWKKVESILLSFLGYVATFPLSRTKLPMSKFTIGQETPALSIRMVQGQVCKLWSILTGGL